MREPRGFPQEAAEAAAPLLDTTLDGAAPRPQQQQQPPPHLMDGGGPNRGDLPLPDLRGAHISAAHGGAGVRHWHPNAGRGGGVQWQFTEPAVPRARSAAAPQYQSSNPSSAGLSDASRHHTGGNGVAAGGNGGGGGAQYFTPAAATEDRYSANGAARRVHPGGGGGQHPFAPRHGAHAHAHAAANGGGSANGEAIAPPSRAGQRSHTVGARGRAAQFDAAPAAPTDDLVAFYTGGAGGGKKSRITFSTDPGATISPFSSTARSPHPTGVVSPFLRAEPQDLNESMTSAASSRSHSHSPPASVSAVNPFAQQQDAGGGGFRDTLRKLQGSWRTSDGQVATVAGTSVTFHNKAGEYLPPERHLQDDGGGMVTLMGVALVRSGARRVLWGDGDVWQGIPEAPDTAVRRRTLANVTSEPTSPLTPTTGGTLNAENAVVHPSAFMTEAEYIEALQQDAESPIIDDDRTQRRLTLRRASGVGLPRPIGPAQARIIDPVANGRDPSMVVGRAADPNHLGQHAPLPRGGSPRANSVARQGRSRMRSRLGSLIPSFQPPEVPAQRALTDNAAGGAGPSAQEPMDAGADDGASAVGGNGKTVQFSSDVAGGTGGSKFKTSYIPDGEGYESAAAGGRRYSTAPNLLRRVRGNQKVVKHLAKLPCCCCLSPDSAVGDEYVDLPNSTALGQGASESKQYYVKKVRSILTPRSSSEEYEAHAVIVYKAFKRFPDVQNWSAAQRWSVILQAMPPDNPEMRTAFEKVSKATGALKVPVSLLHQTRLIELWWAIDEDSSGRMDFKEIRKLMGLLNVSIKPSDLREKMKEFDEDQNGEFDFDEFVHFYDWLQRRYELEAVHRELLLAQPAQTGLFEEKLLKFLHQTQGELHITNVHAMEIAKEWRFNRDNRLSNWDLQEFSRYMTSTLNTWWDPEKLQPCQDLNQPLVHYYISSSHNTYLTGNQMWAQSSSNMYTYALIRGCRCVEVDCWDGPNGEPIVYHGYTKTTRISFESVIEAINADAFTSSELPVIISLEVHTNEEQQIRMVEIMKRIFGSKLHPPIAHEECGPEMYLKYTPYSLRRKILLKGPMIQPKLAQQEDITYEEDDEGGDTNAAAARQSRQKQKVHVKVSEALSSVIFLKNTKLRDGHPNNHLPPHGKFYECTSLSETTVEKLERRMEDCTSTLARMNKFVFTRVYPKGTRIDSSNYFPAAWSYGCQMVAFNFQTPDYPMRLNQAFFKQNGGCGYVLKPRRLRDPNVDPLRPTCPPATLKIFIISGGNLPKPNHAVKGEIIDPQVEIIVSFSAHEERLKKRLKTNYIDDNGFNPVWKEAFNIVIYDPEVAVVTLRVMDYDVGKVNDFIAEASCPLSCIRKGFRSVPLFDAHHRSIPGSFLLCRFDIS